MVETWRLVVFLLLCVWVGDGVSEKIEHVNIIKGIVHKCPNFLILCKSLSCCGGHLEFPIHIAVLPMKIDMLKRH
jgi:hypothetical protein